MRYMPYSSWGGVLRSLLLSALLCLSARSGAGNAPSMAFRHVGMEAGLTHERVSSFFAGSKGFLWLSTLWGVDCYDGNSVASFAVPDSVLRGGEVLEMQEFGPDTMLVRMSTGIAIFRRERLAYSRADGFIRARGLADTPGDVWVDGGRNVWLVGSDSIMCAPAAGGRYAFHLPDGVGVACVSPSRFGLAALLADGRIVRCAPPAPGCAPSPQVFTTPIPSGGKVMRTDDSGGLWVISQSGDSLWHKPMAGLGWELVNKQPYWSSQVPSGLVDVAIDISRRIWLVSDQDGACVIDPADGSVTPLKRDPSSPFSLRSNLCTCVQAFSSGSVVIGYQHSGFSVYHPAAFKFAPLALSPASAQSDLTDVRSLVSDGGRYAYIGSNSGGVLKVDVSTRQAERVPFDRQAVVERMAALPDGSLWAFVSGRGFARYSPSGPGPQFTYFAEKGGAPEPLTENNAAGVVVSLPGGCLWAAAERQILAMPNAASPGDMFRGCAAARLDDEVVTLRRSQDSTAVLVLTRSAFYMARLADGRVELHRLSDCDMRSERPSDICQGVYGFFWVATSKGVAFFTEPDSAGVARHLQDVELTQPAVSLTPCPTGGALGATSSDVCFFKVFKRGKGDYRVVSGLYNASSGLLPGVNSPRAALTLPSGEVWIGSESGVNVYVARPDDDSRVPKVSFCSLNHNGRLVLPGQSIAGVTPLDRALPLCSEVTLPSGHGTFSIDLSVLGAPSPKSFSYLCEVAGADIPPLTSHEPFLVLPDMGSGSYTLRVTAVDPEGRMSECPTELRVNFYVPWYESPWLPLAVALALCLVAFAVALSFTRHKVHKVVRSSADAAAIQSAGAMIAFGEKPAVSSDIEATVLKSVAANVATAIDILADDIRTLSDNRGLPLTDSIAIRNLTSRLISANSALAAVAGAPMEEETEGRAHLGRHDVVAATRTIVRQVAAVTLATKSVGFSSPLRNCIFSFDAQAFRTILIDIVVDAIVSTAGRGFVRVMVEKGKFGADLLSVSVCIGGEVPTSSLYFNAAGSDPVMPANIEACLHRLAATVRTADYGDGLLYAFIHIPVTD